MITLTHENTLLVVVWVPLCVPCVCVLASVLVKEGVCELINACVCDLVNECVKEGVCVSLCV